MLERRFLDRARGREAVTETLEEELRRRAETRLPDEAEVDSVCTTGELWLWLLLDSRRGRLEAVFSGLCPSPKEAGPAEPTEPLVW